MLAILGKAGEDVKDLVAEHSNGGEQPAPKEEAPKEQPAANAEEKPAQKEEVSAPVGNGSSIDISKMEEVVLMPRLSDTMTEGVIAAWNKNVGDAVKKGEVLAEIETDKATMDLESYKDGTLLYQGAQQGEKIAVNELLCIIGKEGMNIDEIVAAAKGGGAPAPKQEEAKAPGPSQQKEQPEAAQKSPEQPAQPAEQKVVNEGRIIASPLAKKLAEEKGIDLKYVKGSGDNGRIVKEDVDNYKAPAAAQQPAQASSATTIQPINQSTNQTSFDEVPVSQMRKTIARRLAESKFSAPHFYLTMSIDMDAVVASRIKLNEVSKIKISFNDIVLKAVAVALKQNPKVNSSWLGDKIRYNHHVSIGVAVAVEEGLLVPVIRFADTKSLSQIAAEVKDVAQKAKDKKLQPADWEGSTFTISNLGMFGIDEFTAIINPPDACILAIGGISQVPVVKNGQVVPGNVMKVTLSCDHRVVDGATGAAFLQTLKGLLEEPLRMLV